MLINNEQFKALKNISKNNFILVVNIRGHFGLKDIPTTATFIDTGILIDQLLINKAFIDYNNITDIRLQNNVIFLKTNDTHAQSIEIILGKCNYQSIFSELINKINSAKNQSTTSIQNQTNNELSKQNVANPFFNNHQSNTFKNRIIAFLDSFKSNQYKAENQDLKNKLASLGANEYFEVQEKISELNNILEEKQQQLKDISFKIELQSQELNDLQLKTVSLENTFDEKNQEFEKRLQIQKRKIEKCRELYKSMDYCLNKFFDSEFPKESYTIPKNDLNELESLSPTVILKLHSMDIKSLKKEFNENDRKINQILNQYSTRYTTKANQAIYQLMVIALRAELQNILYNLKYEKLDVAVENVKSMTDKYLKIASDGNQTITNTLVKFIGEIEYLFINAVKIEYNYYAKKEQARQEQLAIRQQMRDEAEERQQLLNQQKQIEKEETKYNNEINKINSLISENTDSAKIAELEAKLLELQSKLSDVTIQKDEIIKLQNGKAGHVYIISNIGSFGENVFKIGMTRRLDPQDRIDELGNASVPFKFDVHSFIFSDDAVSLEKKLHSILNSKRVNKVNLRKEFFTVTIDELENLVTQIEPTAEFIKTIQATEFKESLSTNENYFIDEQLVAN